MKEMKRGGKPDVVFEAPENGALLECVTKELEGEPRSRLKAYLEHRQISVDGFVTSKFDYPVKAGQTVRIRRSDHTSEGLDIIYEDDYILAVNKPAGLLSVASDTEKERTAFRLLKDSGKAPVFVVHRLDKETSGVLLFAKSAEIRDELQENWDETPKREYTAVCEGIFEEKRGRCDTILGETSTHRLYSKDYGEGKRAITNYEVIGEKGGYSLLRVWIETGRKNQIRVHMSELNHPVAGDKKYGAATNPLGRLGLHASVLEIIHPVTKKKLMIKAKPDSKFHLPKIPKHK